MTSLKDDVDYLQQMLLQTDREFQSGVPPRRTHCTIVSNDCHPHRDQHETTLHTPTTHQEPNPIEAVVSVADFNSTQIERERDLKYEPFPGSTFRTMSDQVTPAHSDEVWSELCSKTIELVPKAIGHDAWILIIASTLITSPSPELLGEFSAFLTRCRPEFSTNEAKKSLSLRLRAVCLKLLTIVGAPRMLSALMPLAKSEGDVMVKGEHSVLSDKWSNINVPEIHARGTETIHSIYDPHFLPRIFAQWGSHKEDVKFSILVAVYGLYLSDFESISAVETEAVVFASIMCQGLRGPALWHMRGMGRMLGARGGEGDGDHHRDRELGAIKDQLRNLKVALIGVVEFVGDEYVRRAAVEAWCNVGDVQRELGGWGEDSR